MRKIYYLIIVLILFISTYCYATTDTLEGEELTTSANIEGVTTTDTVEGQVVTSGGTSCPDCYNDANVVWSWDGDHDDGHNTACDSAGNADLADTDNATTHTDYGEDGSVGMLIEDANQYLQWTQTDGQYLDEDLAQTICIRCKISGVLTPSQTHMFKSLSATDQIRVVISSGESVYGFYAPQAGAVSVVGTKPDTTTWETVAYSWDMPTNEDHSANPGDAVDPDNDWATTWDPDDNELANTMANFLANINIGNFSDANPGVGEYIYIDRIAIVSGYEFDCSTLTGW